MWLPYLITVLVLCALAGVIYLLMDRQMASMRVDLERKDQQLLALLDDLRLAQQSVVTVATNAAADASKNAKTMVDTISKNTEKIADTMRESVKVVWTPQTPSGDVATSGGYQLPVPMVADEGSTDPYDFTDALLPSGDRDHQGGIVADPPSDPATHGGFFGVDGLVPIV